MNASANWWYLAAVLGCAGCGQPPEHDLADAHALPPHHPRTFHRAVAMLGGDDLAPTERLDVIRWLPELAADTTLGREPWERVVRLSAALAAADPRSPAADGPLASLRAINATLPPEDRHADLRPAGGESRHESQPGSAP